MGGVSKTVKLLAFLVAMASCDKASDPAPKTIDPPKDPWTRVTNSNILDVEKIVPIDAASISLIETRPFGGVDYPASISAGGLKISDSSGGESLKLFNVSLSDLQETKIDDHNYSYESKNIKKPIEMLVTKDTPYEIKPVDYRLDTNRLTNTITKQPFREKIMGYRATAVKLTSTGEFEKVPASQQIANVNLVGDIYVSKGWGYPWRAKFN